MITPDNESVSLIRFAIASTTVIGLIGLFAIIMKRLSTGEWNIKKPTGTHRLKIMETLTIDARRRLVILRCDSEEHIMLLGNNNDVLIKSGIPALAQKSENTVQND